MKTTAIILLVIAGLMLGAIGCTGIKQADLDARDREIMELKDKLAAASKDEAFLRKIVDGQYFELEKRDETIRNLQIAMGKLQEKVAGQPQNGQQDSDKDVRIKSDDEKSREPNKDKDYLPGLEFDSIVVFGKPKMAFIYNALTHKETTSKEGDFLDSEEYGRLVISRISNKGVAVRLYDEDGPASKEYMLKEHNRADNPSKILNKVLNGQVAASGAVSNISFARKVNPDNSPISPTATFKPGKYRIYACFANEWLLPGLSEVIIRWTNKTTEEVVMLEGRPINPDAKHSFVWLEKKTGWSAGEYSVELFNERTLAYIAQGAFTVVAGEKNEADKEESANQNLSGLEFILTGTVIDSEAKYAFLVNVITRQEMVYTEGDVLDSKKHGRWTIVIIEEGRVVIQQYNKDGSVAKEQTLYVATITPDREK
ncbi:MAG: hypothetical protein AB1599_02605 [Planctomycetota bacterium]